MSIASKNLYDLLGNDPELDPERPESQKPPAKAVDRPSDRTGKRNAPAEKPAASQTASTGGRPRDSRNANDNAFRDRGVGADRNRTRGSGEPVEYPREGGRGGRGRGRGRGGRGGGGFSAGDRHSRTGVAEHDKQAAHGWGGQDGQAEWADEKAGEAIAKEDEKEDGPVVATEEEAAEAEPEDKTKSYAAYLIEQAEKKLSLSAENVRKPNEGSSKKFPEGKAISRDDQEDFISGSGGKAKRERERKAKEFVQIDNEKLYRESGSERGSFRGRGRGRGEFRGGEGRGRGEFRGGEGRGRGGRGRGEGRGDFRGGEGRGRGGRGGQSGPNVTDTNAFPSLGS